MKRDNNIQRNDRKEKRLWILGLLLLTLSVGTIVGVSLAYFSDVITGGGQAVIGTLDLNATKSARRHYLKADGSMGADNLSFDTNGVLIPVANLNPGDIIEISLEISNVGTKSAWVRDQYSLGIKDRNNADFTGLGMFVFYKSTSAIDLTDIRNGTALNPINASATGISQVYTQPVIYNGGSGTAADENDGGIDTATNPQTVRYYLYFKEEATNEYQNATLDLSLRTEAVQYRNNPNSSSIDWSDAESLSTEFSLQ